jgi:hypothetical protein
MPPTHVGPTDQFISTLRCALSTFDDSISGLLPPQRRMFKSCSSVLRESKESIAKRSKAQRCVVLRARQLLADIFQTVGKEVFFLCAITMSVSKLNTIASTVLLPQVRSWWSNQRPPRGLVQAASASCNATSIGTFICSYQPAQLTTGKND